ncbi:MAG: thioredoxin family protein [Chthoniobacterales bacterium]
MKKKFSLCGVTVFAFLVIAGVSMIVSPAMAKGNWLTDYTAALAQAKKENRPVLIDFTGSDWCGWCIKLDKETFTQPAFQEFAKKNLVLFEADFPRGIAQTSAVKKQNNELQTKFAVEGFPTQILVDSNGKEIARHEGYLEGGPKGFIDWVNKSLKK